jgi:NADPH2:quinone reductase
MWGFKQAVPIIYPQIYYGLESVADGLKAIENRETWGKAVLRIKHQETGVKL